MLKSNKIDALIALGGDVVALLDALEADTAVVFVTQHDSEGSDASLELTGNQDALVAAVAEKKVMDGSRVAGRANVLFLLLVVAEDAFDDLDVDQWHCLGLQM